MTALIRIGVCVLSLSAIWATPGMAEIATTPTQTPDISTPPVTDALVPDDYEFKPARVAYVLDGGSWDDSQTMLDDAFKSIYAALARGNIHSVGAPLVEYLDSDDTTFSFRAMVRVDAAASGDLGPDVKLGDGPTGKALKFVHRGSFEDLEQVYNRIDDYLASKNMTMERIVEEYVSDQMITSPDSTITNIYVFTK